MLRFKYISFQRIKNPRILPGIKTNNHENSIKHEYYIVLKNCAKIERL